MSGNRVMTDCDHLSMDPYLEELMEELDTFTNELRELERVLLRLKEERNLKPNPALKMGHFDSGGVGDDELVKNCAVCLDDFEIGSEVIWMPCSHMFHEGCLLGWLMENKSCPLCRLELPD